MIDPYDLVWAVRLCEKQTTESELKTVCVNLLGQAQSWFYCSWYFPEPAAWVGLHQKDFGSAVHRVFYRTPVVVRKVFISFKKENLGVQAN